MPKDANKYKPVLDPSPSRLSLRERFNTAPPPKSERVTVDFGDGTDPFAVEVRELIGRDRLRLLDASIPDAKDGDGETKTRLVLAVYTPLLVALTVHDPESGERIWPDGEEAAAGALPAGVLEQLSAVASRLNRMGREAHDEGKAGSGATPSAGTSTSSPTN